MIVSKKAPDFGWHKEFNFTDVNPSQKVSNLWRDTDRPLKNAGRKYYPSHGPLRGIFGTEKDQAGAAKGGEIKLRIAG
jgi:hypothetical protein